MLLDYMLKLKNGKKWYKDYLTSEYGEGAVREFDRFLPDYKGVSDVKKIDSVLWGIR